MTVWSHLRPFSILSCMTPPRGGHLYITFITLVSYICFIENVLYIYIYTSSMVNFRSYKILICSAYLKTSSSSIPVVQSVMVCCPYSLILIYRVNVLASTRILFRSTIFIELQMHFLIALWSRPAVVSRGGIQYKHSRRKRYRPTPHSSAPRLTGEIAAVIKV